ncbi:hypothetical protein [Desulforamulus ruminis]|uniref:hypothetical protein n=1 Tax=Desulforamulus ruminis TaxID=1564 RepID=UPI00030DA2E7|nr:hypothetical protein [Desulforamulus ruminis]
MPIGTGRYPTAGGQVLGVFKTRPEVIRSRTANDLPTIAHEVGHVLDKRLGLQNPVHDVWNS